VLSMTCSVTLNRTATFSLASVELDTVPRRIGSLILASFAYEGMLP
jgi:hypothetical protein